MANYSPRQSMPEQPADARVQTFSEVALGYAPDMAVLEATRCLQCKQPACRKGCPVDIDIPGFIRCVKDRDFSQANAILKHANNLPAICGRVCPQETQCEQYCIVGLQSDAVAIGRLERFAADWALQYETSERTDQMVAAKKARVAIIGSGPAGLACAADLARNGFRATIFEALHDTGGVLRYGIPDFRLPRKVLDAEVDFIKALGVQICLNVLVGRTKTIDQLKDEGFQAFFLGTGAGLPGFLQIPGENSNGVYSANEYLTRVNLMQAYTPHATTPITVGSRVCVIGAGNVAMDSARSALRLGADQVTIVYRRTEAEMPARKEEIAHARQEGIAFKLLTSPRAVQADTQGWVTGLRCQRNELGPPDKSGRCRPVPVPGAEFDLSCDTVIVAIGQSPNPMLARTLPELTTTERGTVLVDEQLMTSMPGVFAGGDLVTGSATVIEAMGAGKMAAQSIAAWLSY